MSKFLHENSKSKKGHHCVQKIEGLPPQLIWDTLLIVNNYSEFQVNIFSNNRDIWKYHCFCMKILSRKRGITLSKKIEGLPPLLVWVPLLIVNNYSEFQINIFSNNRDIWKCQSFCTTPPPPTTTPPGLKQYLDAFIENSRANKTSQSLKQEKDVFYPTIQEASTMTTHIWYKLSTCVFGYRLESVSEDFPSYSCILGWIMAILPTA